MGAEQRFSQFHDVFWWSKRAIPLFHAGMKKLQRWKHLNSELNSSFLQRTRRRDTDVVLNFSTFGPERDTLRHVGDNLTDMQLEASDGSSALMIVKTVRLSAGPKSNQEAVRLLLLDSSDSILFDIESHCNTRKVGQALKV